jgi:hypothetical protein
MNKKMRYFLVFLISIVILTTATIFLLRFTKASVGTEISEGLLGYWPLDEGVGNTTADASGNGNEGIVNGYPDWVQGKFGMTLSFDGIDDYVYVGNDPSLDHGTGDFTISAWVKTTYAELDEDPTIFGKGGDSEGGIRYCLLIHETYNSIRLVLDNDKAKYWPEGLIGVTDDQWHHIVGMRDGTFLRIFVDGVQDPGAVEQTDSTAHTEFTIPADYDLTGTSLYGAYIGVIHSHAKGHLQKYFNGLIDDVAIWNRALSTDEVSHLYNNGEGNPVILQDTPMAKED